MVTLIDGISCVCHKNVWVKMASQHDGSIHRWFMDIRSRSDDGQRDKWPTTHEIHVKARDKRCWCAPIYLNAFEDSESKKKDGMDRNYKSSWEDSLMQLCCLAQEEPFPMDPKWIFLAQDWQFLESSYRSNRCRLAIRLLNWSRVGFITSISMDLRE